VLLSDQAESSEEWQVSQTEKRRGKVLLFVEEVCNRLSLVSLEPEEYYETNPKRSRPRPH
jgi:hypothetical protein